MFHESPCSVLATAVGISYPLARWLVKWDWCHVNCYFILTWFMKRWGSSMWKFNICHFFLHNMKSQVSLKDRSSGCSEFCALTSFTGQRHSLNTWCRQRSILLFTAAFFLWMNYVNRGLAGYSPQTSSDPHRARRSLSLVVVTEAVGLAVCRMVNMWQFTEGTLGLSWNPYPYDSLFYSVSCLSL